MSIGNSSDTRYKKLRTPGLSSVSTDQPIYSKWGNQEAIEDGGSNMKETMVGRSSQTQPKKAVCDSGIFAVVACCT
jgi:hypothetical protein